MYVDGVCGGYQEQGVQMSKGKIAQSYLPLNCILFPVEKSIQKI
jgi:hypothetical protein